MRAKRIDQTFGPDWGDGEEIFLEFAVRDTGRGLTPEEKKLLFQRFSQASPRTHVQYGGSGLGLFISRELTELQGGEIGVSSEAGIGSTFAFYVKCRRSNEPQDPIESTAVSVARKLSNAKDRPMDAQVAPKIKDFATMPSKNNAPKPKPKVELRVLIVEDNLGMLQDDAANVHHTDKICSKSKGPPTPAPKPRYNHQSRQSWRRSTRVSESVHLLERHCARRNRARCRSHG